MRVLSSEKNRLGNYRVAFIWAVLMMSFALSDLRIFAHGGEDHGDQKPKIETAGAGMFLRTARLGDLEVVLKHSVIEPDIAVTGRLFITKFSTNEPVDLSDPVIEIESSAGAVTKSQIERTEAPGTYTFTLPALPEGSYALRIIAAPDGKTATATFSDVEIAHAETASSSSGISWLQTAFMGLLVFVALALFAGLVYLAIRAVGARPLHEEAASV